MSLSLVDCLFRRRRFSSRASLAGLKVALGIHQRLKDLMSVETAFWNALTPEKKLGGAVPVVAKLLRKIVRDVTFFR